MAVAEEYFVKRGNQHFVRFAGLLMAAHQEFGGELQIKTEMKQAPTEENAWTAIFKAEVSKHLGEGFIADFSAHGDANPDTVGAQVADHYIRMAETRAIARALRFALGVDVAAIEEILEGEPAQSSAQAKPNGEAELDAAQEMEEAISDFDDPDEHEAVLSDIKHLMATVPPAVKKRMPEMTEVMDYASKSVANAVAAKNRITVLMQDAEAKQK